MLVHVAVGQRRAAQQINRRAFRRHSNGAGLAVFLDRHRVKLPAPVDWGVEHLPILVEDRQPDRQRCSLHDGRVIQSQREVLGRHARHFKLKAFDLAGRVVDLAHRPKPRRTEVRHAGVVDVPIRRVQSHPEPWELHEHQLHDAQHRGAQGRNRGAGKCAHQMASTKSNDTSGAYPGMY
ncbi:hypothetical protein D3C87_1400770 [compost metagenome]